MARHNKLRDGVANLVSKAFTPMHMCDNPKIKTSLAVRGSKGKIKGSPLNYKEDMRGVLLIRDLWTKVTYSIHNMHVVITDANSYWSKNPRIACETMRKIIIITSMYSSNSLLHSLHCISGWPSWGQGGGNA